MRAMKVEGVSYFSLSLAPFLRCTPIVGDSALFRTVANFWWRRLNGVYDVRGLFHFKSRFHPDYREMYLAAKPGVTPLSLLAMARIWKLLHFNPLRLVQRRLLRKRGAQPNQMAIFAGRPDRLLRELRRGPGHFVDRAPHLPARAVEETQCDQTHAPDAVPI